jgi:hypothetical protein
MLGLSLEVDCFCGIIAIRKSPCSSSADIRRDFSRYDEQKEMIESVGLFKAKRGMLKDLKRDQS